MLKVFFNHLVITHKQNRIYFLLDFDLDLNSDGFVDENEFNEVVAKKSNSLDQR